MDRRRPDRWLPSLILLAGAAFLVYSTVGDGSPLGFGFLAIYALLGWWAWPGRRGRHMTHSQAQTEAGELDVIVYWRPG